MTGKLYIAINVDENKEISVTIESFVALYVFVLCEKPSSVDLYFVEQREPKPDFMLKINSELFDYRKVKLDEKDHETSDLRLPVFAQQCTAIAGLCAVCREIILEYKGDQDRRKLLGFKESCLLAPAECSVWTKFCEIDIVDAVQAIRRIVWEELLESQTQILIPLSFSRFETHMSQPVRVHNVYKLAREKANESGPNLASNDTAKKTKGKIFINSGIPIENLNIDHRYAEGCYPTLADVILYACYSLCFKRMVGMEDLARLIPLTFKWFEAVTDSDDGYKSAFESMLIRSEQNSFCTDKPISYAKEETDNVSLYKSDPKRYKPRDRIYTRQDCVEESLEQFAALNITASSETAKHFDMTAIDCDPMLFDSYPAVGDLPEKRLVRKKQQLENVANAVVSIAKDNDRIVDFCSGSGHLGIILAAMLPTCHVIFLENKAISLKRARDRTEKLNLKNCSFYQSNLDYFVGKFDIGTSLHACGTATDIVIWQCIRNKAKFVCCPCCYGSVASMPHISYPRSQKFSKTMDEKNYLYIAHAADQAHNAAKTECNVEKSVQGQLCMDIIDTDRKLMAEEAGYEVTLTRLQPEDCTPKNRLLLGVI